MHTYLIDLKRLLRPDFIGTRNDMEQNRHCEEQKRRSNLHFWFDKPPNRMLRGKLTIRWKIKLPLLVNKTHPGGME